MRVLGSAGNEILLLARPDEDVTLGEYYALEDPQNERELLVQVFDLRYLDHPGIVDEIVREEVLSASAPTIGNVSDDVGVIASVLKDLRVVRVKVRATIENGTVRLGASWLPPRSSAAIRRVSETELMGPETQSGRQIVLGHAISGSLLAIDARVLDGHVSIVIGRKESGKSHLAKLLVARLAELGAPVLVFDLNGEYVQLHRLRTGHPGPLNGRLVELRPGKTLRFSLRDLGREVVSNLLSHVFETSGITIREFLRIWDLLEERGTLTLPAFFEALRTWRCNEFVRDALLSRLHSLFGSSLVAEEAGQSLEGLFQRLDGGGVAVVNLRELPGLTLRLTVEILLSKLVQLAHRRLIPPLFLFAEEAHLYLRATYWEDLLTRMRHFGIFTTFITNQPDALSASVYRQVDNVFAFGFSNEADVETVARSSATDAETIRAIVRTLPSRHCLLLGKVVREFPVVVRVEALEAITLGDSRLFFREAVALRTVRQAFNAA